MKKNDKIMDIYGYYAPYGMEKTLENSWAGRIILHEDSSFEGIAKMNEDNDHLLVFGNIKGSVINAYTASNNEEYPRFHKSVKENPNKDNYYGTCYATDGGLYYSIGESMVALREAEKNRDITKDEFKQIEEGIELVFNSLNDAQMRIYNLIAVTTDNKVGKVK